MNFNSANVEHKSTMLFNTNNNGKKFIFSTGQTQLNLNNLLIYWNFSNNTIIPAFQANSYIVQQEGPTQYLNDGPNGSKVARLTPGHRIALRSNLWHHTLNPSSFTISTWVRKIDTNTTPSQGIILGSIFGPMGVALYQDNVNGGNLNNNLVGGIIHTTVNGNEFAAARWTTNFDWSLNQWIHAVITHDYPNKTIRLYTNGILRASQTYGTLGITHINWDGICLNGSPIGTSSSEYGNSYDFALTSIWNRNLSDNEVSLLYSNPTILN